MNTIVVGLLAILGAAPECTAQELIPAAYTPAPYGVNFVGLALTSNRGDLAFDPSGPIDEADADIIISTFTYARTLNLFKRSATATVILPYVVGDLEGLYLGEPAAVNRSGTGDLVMRLGVNLLGGAAMQPREFAAYRPKTLLGASLTVRAPTGQYDPTRLINIGTNRWSFKPEIGVVQVMGRWAVDAYVGAWIFTENSDFIAGTTRRQDPIYSSEVHLRYLFKRGLWAALDANYWYGGKATINGVGGDDLQNNSRVGFTVSWQLKRSHNLRFAASRGAFTRIGGDFDSFGVAYGYTWAKKP
ncbi:MAG: transporter [Candidatus Sulfomarinibacteraceae bacterium]